MKTKLTELTEQFGLTFEELLAAKNKYVDASEMTGTGRNTWLTPRGVEMLAIALSAEEIAPEVFEATVLHPATNPRWVICMIKDVGKKPVLIPNRLAPHMQPRKRFQVHAIKDHLGTTYRHASLTT